MTKQPGPAGSAQIVPSASLSKRRAAKRDSARRARAKNKDLLSSFCNESKELETSNEGLTQELTLTDAEVTKLQQQVVSVCAQTMYIRTVSEQLNQELSMLERMNAGLIYKGGNLAAP